MQSDGWRYLEGRCSAISFQGNGLLPEEDSNGLAREMVAVSMRHDADVIFSARHGNKSGSVNL
jgi:hypothetical protein